MRTKEKNYFKSYLKEYRQLSKYSLISITIILAFILSDAIPEINPVLGELFNFLYQLSIGFIVSYIFFFLNVYYLEKVKEKKAAEHIKLRLYNLLKLISMDKQFFQMLEKTIQRSCLSYLKRVPYYL